jgi:hypothetical protein
MRPTRRPEDQQKQRCEPSVNYVHIALLAIDCAG